MIAEELGSLIKVYFNWVNKYLIEKINGLPSYLTPLLKILVYAPIMPYSSEMIMYINFILTRIAEISGACSRAG
jgi:hypothetical protein